MDNCTIGFRVDEWTGCDPGRFTNGFRVVAWTLEWAGCPDVGGCTIGLWIFVGIGCLAGRLPNGFSVDAWIGCAPAISTNGFRVVEWIFVGIGSLAGRSCVPGRCTNGFKVVECMCATGFPADAFPKGFKVDEWTGFPPGR